VTIVQNAGAWSKRLQMDISSVLSTLAVIITNSMHGVGYDGHKWTSMESRKSLKEDKAQHRSSPQSECSSMRE
jgi:hypothetical protein